ncbi:MAG TPA: restriction endonuclease subunit S [Fervidobacterium sp.]|nr:restriction endonuclease subunit S [Fervidobacterium sp.]HPP17520.1 restriction endonuclease subunit S [Fervidobacterium sp.]
MTQLNKAREGYKLTEIGEIPKEWEVKKLGEVCEDILTGGTPLRSNKEFWENGSIPWLTNEEIKEDKINFVFDSKQKISQKALKETNVKIIPKNSLIISLTASVGKVAINKNEITTNQQFNSFILKKYIVDNVFLAYYILLAKKRLELLGGATTFKFISKSTIMEFYIPIPPLPEQQKIADILSSVDEQIENVDKLIEKTKELKKGLMQRLLTKGIGHKEFKKTEIGVIPKEWEVKKIEDIIKRNNTEIKKLKTSEYEKVGIYPVIDQGQEYIAGYTNDENLLYKGELPVIIFGDHTRIIKYIDFPFVTGADGTQLIIPNDEFNKKYFYYTLSNLKIKNEGYQRHFKYLKESLVPKPDINEQQKIADILSSVDDQIEEYQTKKEKLEMLKKGLMQKLLTGKIRVKV